MFTEILSKYQFFNNLQCSYNEPEDIIHFKNVLVSITGFEEKKQTVGL